MDFSLVVAEKGFFPHLYSSGQPSCGTSVPHLVMFAFDILIINCLKDVMESWIVCVFLFAYSKCMLKNCK